MGRHASPSGPSGSRRRRGSRAAEGAGGRRRRPGSDLLGWAAFTAALTAAALLWAGVALSTAVAVPALVLAAFAVVWVAAWRAGSAAADPREPPPGSTSRRQARDPVDGPGD